MQWFMLYSCTTCNCCTVVAITRIEGQGVVPKAFWKRFWYLFPTWYLNACLAFVCLCAHLIFLRERVKQWNNLPWLFVDVAAQKLVWLM